MDDADELARLLAASLAVDAVYGEAVRAADEAAVAARAAEQASWDATAAVEKAMQRAGLQEVVVTVGGRTYRLWLEEGLGMEEVAPPEVCVVCGQPATDNYPDADGEPSCGRMACEISMQRAADYHDERG